MLPLLVCLCLPTGMPSPTAHSDPSVMLRPSATSDSSHHVHCIAITQDEAPPLYDRGVSQLLAPAATPTSGISMLPGGAEAARRRAAAEACYSTEGKDTAAVTQAAAKRRKLSDNRCFNCGSYAHGLADCSKPLDQVGSKR